jgi:uncharacterized protein (DUF1330 family)
MPFEMTMGLYVADRDTYSRYRAAIAPLLEVAGAGFRYDFDVSKTLKSEAGVEINRVFVLRFPDRGARDRFFADPQYVSIRGRLFEEAVERTVVIAEYDAPTTTPATTPPITSR